MKKYFLTGLLVLLAAASDAQHSLYRAVKLYYRVNPFDRKFSVVLNDILTDTGFVKTDMRKRTDSTFFFLSGSYKRFSPFDFVPLQTQVRLAETEIFFDEQNTSSDTIIMYQVLGIAGPGEENRSKVQRELFRFHKRFRFDFSNSDYKEVIGNDNAVTAAVHNYYVFGRTISVMTAAWGKMPGEDNYTFTVTLKLKIRENFAQAPTTPDETY